MLKLNTSYSKKVPVQGQEFSSQSYHASIEVELPDSKPEEIKTKIHDTFILVKESVEAELNGKVSGNGQPITPAVPATSTPGNGTGSTGNKATNKQIKFITDLATRQNLPLSELNADIKRRFAVDGLYDLSSKQASELVDVLKRAKAA